jgi:hypothetical protein
MAFSSLLAVFLLLAGVIGVVRWYGLKRVEGMRELECRGRMLRLAVTLGVYARGHDGYLPKSLGDLLADLDDLDVRPQLVCPYEPDKRGVSYEFACEKNVLNYDVERLENGTDFLLWHKRGVHDFDHAKGFLVKVSLAIHHFVKTGVWVSPGRGN